MRKPFISKSNIKKLIFPGVGFLLSIFFFIFFSGLHHTLENKVYDILYKARYALKGHEPIAPDICVVNIDDKDIRQFNYNNKSREVSSQIIEMLTEAEVKTIMLDILFKENNIKNPLLTGSTQKADRVIYPFFIQNGNGAAAADKEVDQKIVWYPEIIKNQSLIKIETIRVPYKELIQASEGLGFINYRVKSDPTPRKIPLIRAYKSGYIPSFVLAGLCHYLEVPPGNVKLIVGKYIILSRARSPEGEERDYKIPIDSQGDMSINFTGPWMNSLSSFPVRELFRLKEENRLKELFSQTLLIVSDTSTEKSDFSRGIFDEIYPNSGVISNAINTVLTENYLYDGKIQSFIFSLILLLVIWKSLIEGKRVYVFIPLSLLFFIVLQFCLFIFFNILPEIIIPIGGILFFLVLSGAGIVNKPKKERDESPSFMKELSRIPSVPIDEKNCLTYDVTPKQRQILLLMQKGLTYKKIAELMEIKEGTVKRHITRIKDKTDLNHKNDLLKLFFHES